MDKPLDLNDIITPESINAWPPALGWWLLLFLLLLLVVGGIVVWQRYEKKWRYRRPALEALRNAIEQFEVDQNDLNCLVTLMETVKRVSLTAYGGKSGVELTPKPFLIRLNNTVPNTIFSEASINSIEEALYQDGNRFDITQFYQECRNWVKQHSETLSQENAYV